MGLARQVGKRDGWSWLRIYPYVEIGRSRKHNEANPHSYWGVRPAIVQ